MAGSSTVSKAALYAKRATVGVFVVQFVSSLLDMSPFSPLAGTAGGSKIFGAAFLAVLFAVPAAAVGAIVGHFTSNRGAVSGQPSFESTSNDAPPHGERSDRTSAPAPTPAPRDRPLSQERPGDPITPSAPTEAQWEASLAEFEGKLRRPGLWARVYAENRGDESQTKAAYLRIRAQEIMEESQLAVAAQIEEATRLRAERERDNPELAKLRRLQERLNEIDSSREPQVESMLELVRLLGGSARRKSAGHMGRVWFVHFASDAHMFHDNEQFMRWGMQRAVPAARLYLLQPPSSAAKQ